MKPVRTSPSPQDRRFPNEHDDFKGVEHLQKPQWGTAQIVCGW